MRPVSKVIGISWMALLIVASIGSSYGQPSSPPAPSEQAATVSGRAIRAHDGTPVSKVTVTLEPESRGPDAMTMRTDASGVFGFTAVRPGRYRMRAVRTGYVMDETPVTVEATGRHVRIDIRLRQAGVISGRVLDEEGDPAEGVFVHAWRLRFSPGGRHDATIARSTRTDDLGQYRLSGLMPGIYHLQITAYEGVTVGGPLAASGYLSSYYPGVLSAEAAARVHVRPGAESGAVDIAARAGANLTITGTIADRTPPAAGKHLEEQWHAAGRSRPGYWIGALRSIADAWRSGPDALPGPTPRGAVWRAVAADARFGARMMGRHRGFAAAAVLTLAIGIGASSAVFSAVWPILFDPLPYPDSERILMVADRTNDGAALDVTYGTYCELLARTQAFESLAVVRPWQPVLRGPTEAERLEGGRVTAAYFDVLRTTPALGAGFDPADDRRGAPGAVMLSDSLWRRRFAADPAILGTEVTLGANRYTVTGILPHTFEDVLLPGAEIWTLLQYDPALPLDGAEWGHHLRMVGRLRDGVSTDAARRELDEMARAPQPQFPRVPWASLANGFVVDALQEEITRGARPALLAFSAAVILVLVIATANVANLLLARIVQRRREFAMRAALGASRGRLLRQLLVEGVMLALPAGVAGVLVARSAVNALVALGSVGLPRANTIEIDGRVLAFSIALTFLVGIVVAVFPALHASRAGLQSTLRDGGRTSAGGARAVRQGLVVAEVALALVLLVSAGLLFRSLNQLIAISPGFDPAQVVAAQVQTSGVKFREQQTVRQFFDTVVERASSLPGVTAVAAASQVPFAGGIADRFGITTERDYAGAGDTAEDGSAYRYSVTPEYFRAMTIPLRRGRLLEEADRRGAQPVVVISESLARRRFPGVDPIGHRLHVGPTDRPWFTVVGIVGDVIQESLETGEANAVYVTPGQWHFADPTMWIVARASAAHGVPAAIRGAVRSVDRDQPIVRLTTMDALLTAATADRRFALLVFGMFGAVALVMAVTGLYSALARSVTERTREIGVRAALGASRAGILALILRQGLGLTAIGVVLGVAGALSATRLLETMLFGTSAVEPWTYAAVTALFSLVATAACLVPAARAVSIDPAITLRAE